MPQVLGKKFDDIPTIESACFFYGGEREAPRSDRAEVFPANFRNFSRYTSSLREPEYDGSPYAQELYRGPVRPTNNGCYYQQAIYEDEGMDYAAPLPVYAPVLGKAHLCKMLTKRVIIWESASIQDLFVSEEPLN